MHDFITQMPVEMLDLEFLASVQSLVSSCICSGISSHSNLISDIYQYILFDFRLLFKYTKEVFSKRFFSKLKKNKTMFCLVYVKIEISFRSLKKKIIFIVFGSCNFYSGKIFIFTKSLKIFCN